MVHHHHGGIRRMDPVHQEPLAGVSDVESAVPRREVPADGWEHAVQGE